jgi:tetratricopeptide (TPR) repeat protein
MRLLAALIAGGAAVVAAAWLLRTGLGDAGPLPPGNPLRDVHLAMRAHRWDEAEAALGRLEASTERELLRAEIEIGRGRTDEAIRRLAVVPDTDPAGPRARVLAGQAELKASRLARAERQFLDAIRLVGAGESGATSRGPDKPPSDEVLVAARRGLVYIYGMQARRRELDEQLRVLAGRGPGLGFQDMLVWTLALEDIWINSGVREDLERIVAADPEDRWSRLALAEVLLRGGELEASEAVLAPLPDSDPEALALRARLAWNRSDLESTERLTGEGPPDHPGLARLRGQLALRRGDAAGGAKAFRAALRLDPANQEAMQGLALALRRLGQAEESDAISSAAERHRELTALLELCRSESGRADPTLPARLAAACEAIGRPDLARGWYRAALAANPTDPAIQGALRRLAGAATSAPG